MEKYGFVYIWFDRKHKRYYIGCRWGHEDDGYVCSSPWMKNSYKRRTQDFRRKILTRVYTTRADLLNEEYRWLSKIKNNELGKRYYNLHNNRNGHWSADPNTLKTVGAKISASHRADPNWASWSKKPKTAEQRAKISASVKALGKREDVSKKLRELWQDPEYRARMTTSHVGKKQPQEQINKRINSIKKRRKEVGIKNGHTLSDYEKMHLSSLYKERSWHLENGRRIWE